MTVLLVCFVCASSVGILAGCAGASRRVHAGRGSGALTRPPWSAIAVVVLVGGGLIGLLLAMVRAHFGLADWDARVARYAATHATGASTHTMRLVTEFGAARLLVPIAAAIAVVERRRLRPLATVTFLVAVIGGQYLLADLIKVGVDRARPDLLRLTSVTGPSFPSGHATASSAVLAAFALVLGRGRARVTRAVLVGISTGTAVLVAASRLVLGVHWLTDVLAGLCLGWTWCAVMSVALAGRRLDARPTGETA